MRRGHGGTGDGFVAPSSQRPPPQRAIGDTGHPLQQRKGRDIHWQETGDGSADIALGWCASLGRDRLGEGLLAFAARHRDIDIGVHEMPPTALVTALRRRELDLVILPGPGRPEFASRLLWHEPVRIALGLSHPLAEKQSLTLADLADVVFLVPQDDNHSAVHRLLLEHIGPGASPKSSMRAASAEQIEDEIAAGKGAALFCGDWPGNLRRVVVKPIARPRTRIAFHALWDGRSTRHELRELVSLLAPGSQDPRSRRTPEAIRTK